MIKGEEQRGYGNSPSRPLSFALNLKLVDNVVSSLRVAGCAGERVCWQAEGWTRPMGLGEEARVAAC